MSTLTKLQQEAIEIAEENGWETIVHFWQADETPITYLACCQDEFIVMILARTPKGRRPQHVVDLENVTLQKTTTTTLQRAMDLLRNPAGTPITV